MSEINYNITNETSDEVINEIIAWENSQEDEDENTTERTFTREEILQMIDEAMRNVKGGDDYPACGTEQDKEFQMYSPGICFLKGWLYTGMTYKMNGKFDLPSNE